MQNRLVGFQFEDDQLVTLQFSDGAFMTLSVVDVDPYLGPKDRSRLQRAHQLRKHFINTTLPPWAAVLTLGAIVLVLATGKMQMAGWQLLTPRVPAIPQITPAPAVNQPSTSVQLQPNREAPINSPVKTPDSRPADSSKNWDYIMKRIDQKWSDVKMKHENRGLHNGQSKDL